MASRSKLRLLESSIHSRGGIDWVCEWIEEGKTVTKMADHLGVSVTMIYRYLKLNPEYKKRFAESRRDSAHTLVDQARDLTDDSEPAEMHKVREQVKMRLWSAERYNREAFGQQKESTVQVNIGQLHLNAMAKQRAIEEAECEVIAPTPEPLSLDSGLELSECDGTSILPVEKCDETARSERD